MAEVKQEANLPGNPPKLLSLVAITNAQSLFAALLSTSASSGAKSNQTYTSQYSLNIVFPSADVVFPDCIQVESSVQMLSVVSVGSRTCPFTILHYD
jgi:hypothetical protein